MGLFIEIDGTFYNMDNIIRIEERCTGYHQGSWFILLTNGEEIEISELADWHIFQASKLPEFINEVNAKRRGI